MVHSEHYLKRGSLIGMLLAIVVASGFIFSEIYPCRSAARNHPDAYFAQQVQGTAGSYCQLIVGESSKDFADRQMNLFSGGKATGNGYRSLSSYAILKALYVLSFAVMGMLAGGITGFMIERKNNI